MSANALSDVSQRTAQLLSTVDAKLVFAESCTSGLLAATLSQIPGISAHFCGSFVTYRESLKSDALGVDPAILAAHTAVSRKTTRAMVDGALQHCTEATIALAITGHLGPNAPGDMDGVVFVACQTKAMQSPIERRFTLKSQTRMDRQQEAAWKAFAELNSLLESLAAQ
ncbi:MAG: nicotinamide-nucleotide amidohydrolase family protein [Pirellulaceae bacterium]